MNHPKLEQAMAKVFAAARRHHKFPGRLATSAEEIKQCLDQGFLFIQASTELNLMAAGARQLLTTLGKLPEDPKPAAM